MSADATAAASLSRLATAYDEGRLEASVLLSRALREALKWRSQWLASRLIALSGVRVLAGPFAGMEFTARQSEGALCPKLLGTYEAELHPALEEARAAGVEIIIDVGCAEGYYAVGLARVMPAAQVFAYDIDAYARDACAELARRNGVADRVQVRERFDLSAFGPLPPHSLLIMDVEGAEADLLGDDAPALLRDARAIVETHPAMAHGVIDALQSRFGATHDVKLIFEAPKRPPPGAFGGRLLSQDEFAATWEWRGTPTPWLVMSPR